MPQDGDRGVGMIRRHNLPLMVAVVLAIRQPDIRELEHHARAEVELPIGMVTVPATPATPCRAGRAGHPTTRTEQAHGTSDRDAGDPVRNAGISPDSLAAVTIPAPIVNATITSAPTAGASSRSSSQPGLCECLLTARTLQSRAEGAGIEPAPGETRAMP